MENTAQSNIGKSLLWLVVIVVVLLGGYAVTKQKRSETITFGAILPLTGSGADQAEWIRRGFDLALDEVNKDRKTPLTIAYEDSGGDTQKAISVYRKLRTEFSIPLVLTWGSGIGIALTPLVNEDKVVQMGVATAANAYSTPDDFTFRNFPRAEQEAVFLSDAILHRLKHTEVAILKINNDYGKSSMDSFKERFLLGGGKVIVEETFSPNDSDFRTQLTKLKKLSPKLIYLATYPKEGGLLLRQAKELGLTSRFVASVAILGGKEFFNLAGASAEGLIVATSIPSFTSSVEPRVKAFVQTYTERFGEEPGAEHIYTARAYDALHILAGAVSTCGKDSECIKEKLFKVQNYHGVSGTFSFDRSGDVSSEFNLQIVKNGKFAPFGE